MATIKNKQALIYSSNSLSIEDINVLTLFYEPLIGADAQAIYLTFSSLTNRNNLKSLDFIHKDLFDMIRMSETKFLNSRYKLEAMDLLKTYEKEDSIIYEIHKPLSANQFVNGGVLGIYLNTQIGRENLIKVLNLFKSEKTNVDGYKNVTKSFEDIFTHSNVSLDKLENIKLIDDTHAQNIHLDNKSFDYDKFESQIDISHFVAGPTPTFKRTVLSLATTYNLDINDMISAYTQSMDQSGSFNLRLFKQKARKIYNIKNEDIMPVLEVKSKQNNELLDLMSTVSPEDLLNQFELRNTKNLSIVSDIYTNIPYSRTICNMMIWAVISKLNKLPSLSYFDSMYNTMVEKGIKNEISASEYLFGDKEIITKDNKVGQKNRKNYKDNSDISSDWLEQEADAILKGKVKDYE